MGQSVLSKWLFLANIWALFIQTPGHTAVIIKGGHEPEEDFAADDGVLDDEGEEVLGTVLHGFPDNLVLLTF